ncbi:hypothetical protein DL770_005041 [Monosporascus sp. CRB-9-2]|nr:hypothetical protein DL770_005041 [Monosporascus sp. CRB-9-2]
MHRLQAADPPQLRGAGGHVLQVKVKGVVDVHEVVPQLVQGRPGEVDRVLGRPGLDEDGSMPLAEIDLPDVSERVDADADVPPFLSYQQLFEIAMLMIWSCGKGIPLPLACVLASMSRPAILRSGSLIGLHKPALPFAVRARAVPDHRHGPQLAQLARDSRHIPTIPTTLPDRIQAGVRHLLREFEHLHVFVQGLDLPYVVGELRVHLCHRDPGRRPRCVLWRYSNEFVLLSIDKSFWAIGMEDGRTPDPPEEGDADLAQEDDGCVWIPDDFPLCGPASNGLSGADMEIIDYFAPIRGTVTDGLM